MPYAIRTCPTCDTDFRPSSRHKICPKCRAKDRKDTCPSCEGPKQISSRTCSNCVDQRGELNARWKNGRTRHSRGYILVSVPGHPRVEGRKNFYVMEHILVMEQHLGRYLFPEENIHHLNGIRHDNRLENLELWSKPQPPGARAEDLYHWAEEVVARYKPLFGDN